MTFDLLFALLSAIVKGSSSSSSWSSSEFRLNILLSLSFDQDGRTAVMIAAYRGHKETVEVLIAAGANLNLQNKVRPRCAMRKL